MKPHHIRRCLVLALTVAGAAPSLAMAGEPNGWHSPLNPELELTTSLSEALNVRFGINRVEPAGKPFWRASWADSIDLTDVTFSALVDWDITDDGGLRLTGGAFYGATGWAAPATSGMAMTAGGVGMTPPGEPPESRMLPYLGLGWDADFGEDERLALQLDLGVVFDSGALGTAADGTVNQAMQDLQEEMRLQQYFDSFRYSPVFSAGLRYRF